VKPTLIIAGIVVIGIIVAFLFLRSRVAGSGTIAEVPTRLTKLKKDTDPKAFLGFCTRDEDALYFVYEGGAFFLDYELTTPEKKSHGDAFRKTAADLQLTVTNTTYGSFPVLRVEAGKTERQAAEVGYSFAQRMFGHGQKTIVEFLP
jgi:hypothetical protein